MKTYFIADETAMMDWGEKLAKNSSPGDIIFLRGQLGAGKTTLVRGFLRGLGYRGTVKSPTYTLVETYQVKNNWQVFHFDLYRINNRQELLDIGFEDYLVTNAISLIEWPEKAEKILPKPTISCNIEIPANGLGRIIISI